MYLKIIPYLPILQYVMVFLLLAYVYHNNPHIPGRNEIMFIALGLLIYYFFKKIVSTKIEKYDAYNDGECDTVNENGVVTKNCENKKLVSKDKKSVLTEIEILNHINNTVTNLTNPESLGMIAEAIQLEPNLEKRQELITLFEMTIKDPELTTKMAVKDPVHSVQTAKMTSENPEFVESSKNISNMENELANLTGAKTADNLDQSVANTEKAKIIAKAKMEISQIDNTIVPMSNVATQPVNTRSDIATSNDATSTKMANNNFSVQNSSDTDAKLNLLMKKFAQMEATMQGKNKETVPEFVRKMMEQNKYIDRNGLVKNALQGDMKYSQLDPSQHQPQVRAEDDNWDWAGYSILPPSVWRPRPQADVYDMFQEKKCPVCPMQTTGNTVNLAEWDDSRYVIGSDNISIDYIKELNRKKI